VNARMTAQPLSALDEGTDLRGPILERYRGEVQEVFGELSIQGLPETRHDIGRLRLDQIFVRLRLKLRQRSTVPDELVLGMRGLGKSALARTLRHLHAHGQTEIDERELERLIEDERLAQESPESNPVDLVQALADSGRLVIVGVPGSGKTTLMRWLALTFAQNLQGEPERLGITFKHSRLPLVIELRRLARWIEEPARWPGAAGLAPELARFIADDPRFHGEIKAPIQSAIERGSCLLLFDGLDEVANPALRRRIAESIGSFARVDQGGSNLILVTSRPSGFRDVDLGPNFQISEVQPFTPEDVRQFLGQWYATAYGERSRQDAAALVEEVESKDRIAALATNPLLCSVIAIVYRKGGQLPNRRVELYEECCKVLLETWDKARGVERPIALEGLDWSSKLALLGELAFWMHEQGEEVVVGRDEAVGQLRAPLAKLRQVSEAEAGVEAENFVAAIEDQAGLIQGRGDGTLEFPHRTFQEYLAARHIAEQPGDGAIDLVMPHLNEAWWHEVHLLTLGRLGGSAKDAEHAAKLMETALDACPKPWPWLHRTDWIGREVRWRFPAWQCERQITWLLGRELSFILQGYADARPEGRAPSIENRLRSEVTDFLAKGLVGRAATKALLASRNSLVRGLVSRPLVQALRDRASEVRSAAAWAVGQLGAADVEAWAALLETLGDPDHRVRSAAARALGQSVMADQKIRAALLETLGDPDYRVRTEAALALRQSAVADQKIRAALLKVLRDLETRVVDSHFLAVGAVLLKTLVHPAKWADIRSELLKVQRGPAYEVLGPAAAALGPSAVADPEVRAALLEMLGDSDYRVRSAAARALVQSAAANPEARAALLKTLGDPDYRVRTGATLALEKSAATDPEARAALLKVLRDSEEPTARTRFLTVGGVLLKALVNPAKWADIRSELLNAKGDSAYGVPSAAAFALGESVAADPEARAALLNALGHPSKWVRANAALALRGSTPADPEAGAALLNALCDTTLYVRFEAAYALVKSGARLDEGNLSTVLKVLLSSLNLVNLPWAIEALSEAVDGRALPSFRWVPLAECAKRKRRRGRIRLAIYIVSFLLLAALGLAALADRLPTDSLLVTTGGFFVVLVPALVALMQFYDWMKQRLV
jgi:HEAT repeat protein